MGSKEPDEQPQDGDELAGSTNPKYVTTERIFRLLHLLTGNDCTRQDIFERLKDHYKIGDDPGVRATSVSPFPCTNVVGGLETELVSYDIMRPGIL